jgi:hypothetical protein
MFSNSSFDKHDFTTDDVFSKRMYPDE